MGGAYRTLLAAASAALVTASAGEAAAYDPRLGWHTLETPHFELHFHDGLGELAQRAARAAEAAHGRLVPMLGHEPRRKVQVVLSDEVDFANGSATAFLRPTIHLFAEPPDDRSELNDYEDYLWNLVVHEYTHILHLDNVGGFPAAFNGVFGQLWVPNQAQPRWLVEGVAVFTESTLSAGGRERSSIYDMYLRSELLEDRFFDLDAVTGSPSRWPRGGVAYLHGSRFLDWVAQASGPTAFADLSRAAGSQIVPFAINLTAREQLGADYLELYAAWREALQEQVEEQADRVREAGLIAPVALTARGEGTGEPRFGTEGVLLYVEASADRRPALRRMRPDGSGDRLVAELHTEGTLAGPRRTGRAIVSQTAPHRQFYAYEDLWEVDLESGRLRQLTFGERLSSPDLSPDGALVVAVKRLGAGRTALVTLPASGGEVHAVYQPKGWNTVFTPRFSPDGKRVAFSEHRDGNRDLFVLELSTGRVEQITRERGLDLNPTFDPSGRYLVYASDRSGIYNLYARELETGHTYQVSNVLTGAFRPEVSPDGKLIALVTYSSRGYDVATMPFEPENWRPAPPVDLERPAAPEWETRELYPVRGYRPLATLWPRYWVPVFGADPVGSAVGLTTGGSDTVGLHAWSARVDYGLASREVGFDLGYSTQVAYPSLGGSLGSRLATIPETGGLVERQSAVSAAASFPFDGPSHSLSLTVGYELRYFDPFPQERRKSPLDDPPLVVDRGFASTASVGASFSNVRRFADSISPEEGQAFSIGLRGARPEIGSQFSFGAAEIAAAKYLRMPWHPHHALGLRASGGLGIGDLGNRRVFSLGGIGLRDPLLDLLYLSGSYGAALRGYPGGAFAGNQYVLANVEYRFPITTVDAGAWTLPIFVRRIHGAATFDAGDATDAFAWKALKTSAGLELRAELLLGYGLFTNLRVGYARGFAEKGIDEVFVTLGSSF